ncbi:26S proteasome non-ATPase regulatory subunit [Schizosaccharomyces japonicus yFS275]|uniref:26S proteasome non-ATPase regulatory subunit n=1 Tax=Schizosaccharomyces japonicus (strain yFS275 / FY16936) TaxID=402676 RepID=B6K7X0_SCHJY|nr:26S proteasome non-ATPase regulatory subunit [Schizosaccharomyces japonicus yFS275]EEB09624.1 26S proteasome non-ATPase regulatory subunit [Schizosaccharomyces japonicus yFS275]
MSDSIPLIPGLPDEGRRLLQLLRDLPSNPYELLGKIPNAMLDFQDSINSHNRGACLGMLETILSCLELPLPLGPIVKVIDKLVEPMSWKDLKAFGIDSYLATGLQNPAPELQLYCLKMCRRASFEKLELTDSLFTTVLTSVNSEQTKVAETAIKLVEDACKYEHYFDVLFRTFVPLDMEIMNSELRVRWLDLFTRLSVNSEKHFEMLKTKHVFDLSRTHNDALLELCYIDTLGRMVEAPHTFHFLSDESGFLDSTIQRYVSESNTVYVNHVALHFLPQLTTHQPACLKHLDSKFHLFDVIRQKMKGSDDTAFIAYGVLLGNKEACSLLRDKYGVQDERERYAPLWLCRKFLVDETGLGAFAHALQQSDPDQWMQLWRWMPHDTMITLMRQSNSPLARMRQLAFQCILHIAKRSPIQVASHARVLTELLDTRGEHEAIVLKYQVLMTMLEHSNNGESLPLGKFREPILKRAKEGAYGSGTPSPRVAAKTA